MKQLTEEQKRTWEKYYCRLTAEQLSLSVTDEYIIAYFIKPGMWAYDGQAADGVIINGDYVPGVIWRDGKTYRQAPEPTEEEIDKALDRFYREGIYSGPLKMYLFGRFPYNQGITYGEYVTRRGDPLSRYLDYHPLVLRRIYEIAAPLLYGQREDIQQLVREYQGGNRELLTRIKNQLGGLIYKAQNEFSYIGKKEAFTNLAGKFNKKIPKPDIRYSDASPMGDSDDQRLMIITEPFIFDETDLQLTIDKSLLEALASYKPDKGAEFKTRFYGIFQRDLIDLYRKYQKGWKYGHTIKTLEEFKEKLQQKVSPGIDFTEAAELIPVVIMNELTLQQKRWIALKLKMQPDNIAVNLTAEIMGISESAEYQIRQQLQEIIKNYRPAKKKAAEVKARPRGIICKDDNCCICLNLFPDLDKKYSYCYANIEAKRYSVKPQYAVKGKLSVKSKLVKRPNLQLLRAANRLQVNYINWKNKGFNRIT